MTTSRRAPTATRRLFARYAVVTLVPVLLLGGALVQLGRQQADERGLAEGASAARLVARTSIAPLLDGRPLDGSFPAAQLAALEQTSRLAIAEREVLRLRLRDLAGRVVFSDDGTGLGTIDDEALEAAQGVTQRHLTRLNADAGESGRIGEQVVEAYTPLPGPDGAPIGVLELYLPYSPIARDVVHGQRLLFTTLAVGLIALWLCLLAVSASIARRLRRQAEESIWLANHDVLTGLRNRTGIGTVLADRLATGQGVAVALLDLDRFKQVNDTFGQPGGDAVLATLAERLEGIVGAGGEVARVGGDEFVLLLPAGPDVAGVLAHARAVVSRPLDVGGLPLVVEGSLGWVQAPEDGAEAGQLLHRAEQAMYAAKASHAGVERHVSGREPRAANALTLVAQLGDAIRTDQLVLHYQVKVDLVSGRPVGLEALVRWQHPVLGLLQPDAFLPAAEETELIEPLTGWVLRRALRDLTGVDDRGDLTVAVNVSARSVVRDNFAEDILAVCFELGVDPRRLVIEVTETALLEDPERAARSLQRLHAAGVSVSIDDFGAGHTSLAHLAALPVTELKIDKAFVLAMVQDRRAEAIVRTIVELGHSLGFTVTAEGVETPEAVDRLRAAQCDLAQGYLLGRPVPLDRLLPALHGWVPLTVGSPA